MRYSLLLFLLLSCSYHLGRSECPQRRTLCISYAKEDSSGFFTSELIKQVSHSSNLEYQYSKAPYSLNLTINSENVSQIGYKYDRNNENVRQNNLKATEGRIKVIATVVIVDNCTQENVFGPFEVSEYGDFDYVDQDSLSDLSFINPQNQRTTVLSFSLGQLESIDSAKEAALKPLYQKLAKKIVDAISAYW
jgi:Lipopolysaccharide-assembly